MKKQILLSPLFILIACNPKLDDSTLAAKMENPSITGGQVVDKEIFAKHVVAIYNEGFNYRCTGTLISKNVVLTAAHCVNVGNASHYVVYFARNSLVSDVTYRRVSGIKPHSGYNPNAYDDRNDLGVLRIEGSLPPGYEPMPLPTEKELATMGKSFYAAGYGAITARSDVINAGGGILRYTTQQVLNSPLKPSENHFTVDQRNGHGICFGDSGGPAFVKMDGRRILIGVASAVFSVDTEKKGRPGYDLCKQKAIYISTYPYLGWISKAVKEVR